MSVITLETTDPNLSFIIKKNPANGMVAKSLRSGAVMGWFPHGNTLKYAIHFKELTDNASFTNDGKDYLDVTQYASTYAAFYAMSTLIPDILKVSDKIEAHDHIYQTVAQLRNVHTLKYLNQFIGLDVEVETLSEGSGENMGVHRITASQKNVPINVFAMRVYLLFYLLHADMHQGDLKYMEGMIEKVVGIMTHLKSEYFLWYWFSKNVIVKESIFNKLQNRLGANSSDGVIKLQYGPTQQQRKSFVDANLDFKRNLVDVGCGEGYYLLPYLKKLPKDGHIVGIEPVEKLRGDIASKLEDRKKTDNVTLLSHVDEAFYTDDRDIICIEVIEHMPLDEAKALVNKLLTMNFNKIIISTPNRSFNKFYKTMEGFRHDDHHFEFNEAEFTEFMLSCTSTAQVPPFRIIFRAVGDTVNNISMAQAAIIERI